MTQSDREATETEAPVPAPAEQPPAGKPADKPASPEVPTPTEADEVR